MSWAEMGWDMGCNVRKRWTSRKVTKKVEKLKLSPWACLVGKMFPHLVRVFWRYLEAPSSHIRNVFFAIYLYFLFLFRSLNPARFVCLGTPGRDHSQLPCGIARSLVRDHSQFPWRSVYPQKLFQSLCSFEYASANDFWICLMQESAVNSC